MNTRSIARLGTLAVGLGIGAAWADAPVASADTSNDWLSSVDSLLSGGNATADTANLLYDIISLFGNFSGTL